VSKDTAVLQEASALVSKSGRYGTWAFLPVTDSVYIQSTPSEALFRGELNGLAHLTSNAAEEGFIFVPQSIDTEVDLYAWVSLVFPLFTGEDIANLLQHYPSSNLSIPRFATSGISAPTALDTSATSSGLQQIANLIYGESTFTCPSYWLAEAYTYYRAGGFKFQTSTPVALHGQDDLAVFDNRPLPTYGREYIAAVQGIWARFIKSGNPSILATNIKGGSSSDLETSFGLNNLAIWPEYSHMFGSKMVNLNQTGGIPVLSNKTLNAALAQVNATWLVGPDLKNDFSIVNASTWESSQETRCDFWRSVAARVPM
jgi:carboxylesterase type B